MVEYTLTLDLVFGSLADATRRDILRRVAKKRQTISEIAQHYTLSFAAISKHLQVLEKAKLIIKQRQGKEQVVSLSPATIKSATDYLQLYEKIWNDRLDSLEHYLKTNKDNL